jgi:hypothetical protein
MVFRASAINTGAQPGSTHTISCKVRTKTPVHDVLRSCATQQDSSLILNALAREATTANQRGQSLIGLRAGLTRPH